MTLSSSNAVDSILKQWLWERHSSKGVDEGRRHKAAVESGLRTLSKRKWEKLKEEYLLYQQRLLSEAAKNPNRASAPQVSKRAGDDDDENRRIKTSQPLAHFTSDTQIAPPPQTTYPLNCLVFVKNIQPDTNKTTLKKLFSVAFEDSEGQIDYVDYTKGLDTVCQSRNLQKHFSKPNHSATFDCAPLHLLSNS